MDTARDIAIIVLAVINVIWLLVLCVIGGLAIWLFLKIKSAIPEVLDTSKSTMNSVKGTTEFVGVTAATPVIRIAALVTAISRFFAVLFGGERRRVP